MAAISPAPVAVDVAPPARLIGHFMYLRRFSIRNVRSIRALEMTFEKGAESGWHVILGSNGSGKSTVVRAFALLVMGEKEAYASRQDFSKWLRVGEEEALISGSFVSHGQYDNLSGVGAPPTKDIRGFVNITRSHGSTSSAASISYTGERTQRSIWGDATGWFSASFGPFRRFTGGDRIYDRLFLSNRRLAPHLTALGEDVALTEAISWLTTLHVQMLQDDRNNAFSRAANILDIVVQFLNGSGFLPHGARIAEVSNDLVTVVDGNRALIPIDQLSDGYQSALSMALELIRQMFELYGPERMITCIDGDAGVVHAPGVVAIDEVDAHLHPSWQKQVGRWLTSCFPNVQFIVTTHSPIICRAVSDEAGGIRGSIWRLPAPGENSELTRVSEPELSQLVFGDVLDAYGTDLFGRDVTRSPEGIRKVERLAELNAAALARPLRDTEIQERRALRRAFPSQAGSIATLEDLL